MRGRPLCSAGTAMLGALQGRTALDTAGVFRGSDVGPIPIGAIRLNALFCIRAARPVESSPHLGGALQTRRARKKQCAGGARDCSAAPVRGVLSTPNNGRVVEPWRGSDLARVSSRGFSGFADSGMA